MSSENLLCLSGCIRIITVGMHMTAGFSVVVYVLMWALNVRSCDFPRGGTSSIPFQNFGNAGAVPSAVFVLVSFVLFVLMVTRKLKNEPAFFQSVQASIWTLLAHLWIMFLQPLLCLCVLWADFKEFYDIFNSPLNNLGNVIRCPRVPGEVQGFFAGGLALMYTLIFLLDFPILWYTIREIKYD
mmetsp:Transcript_28114/g.68324  ORF Transcript_28114/g.68324 Transcript_28114/m.68324 type:complete len:184 (+) Transcript_28114:95-646(+)